MKPARGFAPILIILAIILISTITFLGMKFYLNGHNTWTKEGFLPLKEGQSKMPEPTPSPFDETVYPDSIGANWKTYTNTKNGYSIKYPQNFVVEEHKGIEYESTKFISNDIIYPQGEYQQIVKGGVITVTVFQTDDSLSYIIEQYRKNDHFSQFQPVSLGGLDAWKFVFEMLPGYEFEPKIITVKSGKQYWVTAGFAKEDNEKIIKIFNQSLSTFKFIN